MHTHTHTAENKLTHLFECAVHKNTRTCAHIHTNTHGDGYTQTINTCSHTGRVYTQHTRKVHYTHTHTQVWYTQIDGVETHADRWG